MSMWTKYKHVEVLNADKLESQDVNRILDICLNQ